jgi:hypothetical protein
MTTTESTTAIIVFFSINYSLGDTVQADANRNFPERQIFEDRSLKTSH